MNKENPKQFNLLVIKEALRHSELRINDENQRKERLDKRAISLISLYIALIGFILTMMKISDLKESFLLSIIIPFLLYGTYKLLKVLKSQLYAPLGSMPITWLKDEFINHNCHIEEQDVLAHILSDILKDIQASLVVSDESNEKRIKLLNQALNCGAISLFLLVLTMLFGFGGCSVISWLN